MSIERRLARLEKEALLLPPRPETQRKWEALGEHIAQFLEADFPDAAAAARRAVGGFRHNPAAYGSPLNQFFIGLGRALDPFVEARVALEPELKRLFAGADE